MRAKKASSLKHLPKKPYFIGAIVALPIVIATVLISLSSLVHSVAASFAGWGDSSLISACVNARGVPTIVGPGTTTCKTGQAQVSWLKDIDAGSGLTINRSSQGATLSLDTSSLPVTTQRFEADGAGISSPTGGWQDDPNATITETFKAGQIKSTFNGSITMKNGDGTAYVRLKVLPTGGSPSYVGDQTVFRSSSPSTNEYSNMPFTVQKVITVSAGEYSITPQININNPNWGLYYQNSLIVEQ